VNRKDLQSQERKKESLYREMATRGAQEKHAGEKQKRSRTPVMPLNQYRVLILYWTPRNPMTPMALLIYKDTLLLMC
jgi:hypothetical protein